jgi:methylenetetrahydrofolate dehydrogenase (NADP+)/methenyltetrahydrofolate cyclohydrolase
MTQIIDGVAVKKEILDHLKEEIESLVKKSNQRPGLAVILVGNDPASHVYVSMKQKACEQIGMTSFEHRLPEDAGEDALASLIITLNQDDAVHGVLLQVPLPKGYSETKLLDMISPKKDVDGFHPINVGKLLLGRPAFQSCTPYGVCQLLDYYNIETAGKHVVIIGRSNIVGKPLAAMLVQRSNPGNATVTICHSKTESLAQITQQADILIAAIGQPKFVTKEMVKDGAVVIDVGVNRVEDPNSDRGYTLVGDVDFDDVKEKCSAITPVPGGVGPMTIAMLMRNTVMAFKNQLANIDV